MLARTSDDGIVGVALLAALGGVGAAVIVLDSFYLCALVDKRE